jgi:ACS family tartrate transporter-like MFS transporter
VYAAVPAGSLIGSPVAGWLLEVHWRLLAGWHWLFILEGIPAIVFGIVTVFYLTDWPAQAGWLPQDERKWLVNELWRFQRHTDRAPDIQQVPDPSQASPLKAIFLMVGRFQVVG